jgi:lysozyme
MSLCNVKSGSKAMLAVLAALALAASTAEAKTPPTYLRGIDVSSWQGTINWAKVKDSASPSNSRLTPNQKISFAFIRATRGTNQQDVQYANNVAGARANGILAGAYHFAKPNRGNTAEAEAKWFVDYARANGGLKPGDLRPVVDIESTNTTDTTKAEYGGSNGFGSDAEGRAELSNWVLAYCQAIKSKIGVEPIIYCNTNYANSYLNSSLNQQTLWIANYGTTVTDPDTGQLGDWSFWQWSSKTNVDGISSSGNGILTNVDADVFRGSMADLKRLTIPAPEPTSLGLFGTGAGSWLCWRGLRKGAFSTLWRKLRS